MVERRLEDLRLRRRPAVDLNLVQDLVPASARLSADLLEAPAPLLGAEVEQCVRDADERDADPDLDAAVGRRVEGEERT